MRTIFRRSVGLRRRSLVRRAWSFRSIRERSVCLIIRQIVLHRRRQQRARDRRIAAGRCFCGLLGRFRSRFLSRFIFRTPFALLAKRDALKPRDSRHQIDIRSLQNRDLRRLLPRETAKIFLAQLSDFQRVRVRQYHVQQHAD